MGNLLVHLTKYWKEKKTSFGLSFNSFLYKVFPIVQLLAVIFYLCLDWGPKAIAEKLYYIGFFEAAIVKLQ